MVTRRIRQTDSHALPVRGGAYTDIRELIRLRHGSKELDISNANKARNPLSGLLASNFRGRGIDFAEVRTYQPGDDVRTIDWRVTARTGEAHTKLFQEEKERPVLILVDQSQSMFFGSRLAFKSVIAAEVGALLAWTALDRGDRVGGVVFSEQGHREVRPRRSKHSVLRLLHEINDFNQRLSQQAPAASNQNYLVEALRNLRRVVKHGCAVFIVSDFSTLADNGNEEARLHLTQLARHNDLWASIFLTRWSATCPDRTFTALPTALTGRASTPPAKNSAKPTNSILSSRSPTCGMSSAGTNRHCLNCLPPSQC